uniref:Uncharacterized protein n=1 Tax=Timema cristinae TaxID=61476 RepID=A0A7R9H550_TIMCR|nr:unnamed protein product [Timema cristinae]
MKQQFLLYNNPLVPTVEDQGPELHMELCELQTDNFLISVGNLQHEINPSRARRTIKAVTFHLTTTGVSTWRIEELMLIIAITFLGLQPRPFNVHFLNQLITSAQDLHFLTFWLVLEVVESLEMGHTSVLTNVLFELAEDLVFTIPVMATVIDDLLIVCKNEPRIVTATNTYRAGVRNTAPTNTLTNVVSSESVSLVKTCGIASTDQYT